MRPLIECIPNFSEGRDLAKVEQIAQVIKGVKEVKLLHVDIGYDANRTVMTFAGPPDKVVKAAFLAIAKAAEVIDMQTHQGEHPRMGATDVCPLVPISGISMEEVQGHADQLARRVGQELAIPVYLYESNATAAHRRNLAHIRSGEYEGFSSKILDPRWAPDYGPLSFQPKPGQTVIGTRNFLVAYNVNLETPDVSIAKQIAGEIRESGYWGEEGGQKVRKPGLLKGVKAIGWWMEAYAMSQVSTNITDLRVSQVHEVFEAVKMKANKRGIEVRGSELIGLIPKQALLASGAFYTEKYGMTVSDTQTNDSKEKEMIRLGVEKMGLDFRGEFDPNERVIEYMLDN